MFSSLIKKKAKNSRVARSLADYPEWLQFCWDFVKPPWNDGMMKWLCNISFFLLAAVQEIFFLFHLCCMQFFSSIKRLQEFFFKITHLPLHPSSRVKWSAPYVHVEFYILMFGRDTKFHLSLKICVLFILV